jgi:hypothetical protein
MSISAFAIWMQSRYLMIQLKFYTKTGISEKITEKLWVCRTHNLTYWGLSNLI